MRRYETIFILRPNIGEDEISQLIENTSQIITGDNGSIIEIDKWGMKKLAYLIKKESLGYYVFLDYAGTPAAVAEIERKFRIDDAVLKYLTVKTAATIDADGIQQAQTEAAAKEKVQSEEDQSTEEVQKQAEAATEE